MNNVLIYWRDYQENSAHRSGERAWHWHSSAKLLADLVPGDRLWMVTSGKALLREEHQGFLVAVWQVKEVIDNPNDDPDYPADEYRYRVVCNEAESHVFDEPVLVDDIFRPTRASKTASIGRFLQGPRKLTDENMRHLRAVAGPQMAQQWLTGKRQPTEPANTEQ